MKVLTRKQVEGRQAQAVRFTRDVVGDADRAAEIEGESVEDYAERRKFQIENPRRISMARKTLAALEAEIEALQADNEELETENEELQNELDAIADIVAPAEEDESDGDDEGDELGED